MDLYKLIIIVMGLNIIAAMTVSISNNPEEPLSGFFGSGAYTRIMGTANSTTTTLTDSEGLQSTQTASTLQDTGGISSVKMVWNVMMVVFNLLLGGVAAGFQIAGMPANNTALTILGFGMLVFNAGMLILAAIKIYAWVGGNKDTK